jgi:hypothetical protein
LSVFFSENKHVSIADFLHLKLRQACIGKLLSNFLLTFPKIRTA